jgi:hypothetical protein
MRDQVQWTGELLTSFLELKGMRLTFPEIAKALTAQFGRAFNAEQCHSAEKRRRKREATTGDQHPQKPGAALDHPWRRAASAAGRAYRADHPKVAPAPESAPAASVAPSGPIVPSEGGYTILDLGFGQCRWPTACGLPDGLSFRFCGKPAPLGSWCDEHMRQVKVQVRNRAVHG